MANTGLKKEYKGLDILRIICAVLVVSIHFSPFGGSEGVARLNFMFVQYISRNAVPLFFMISSFLLFKKIINDGEHKIDAGYGLKKCLSYLRLYLIWTVVYLFYIVGNVTHGRKTVIQVIRDFFFTGSYFQLWYFPALISATLLIVLLYKIGMSVNRILLCSVVLYIVGLSGQSYYGLTIGNLPDGSFIQEGWKIYVSLFETTRNGLFEAFLFCSLGLKISQQKETSSSLMYIAGGVISFILLVLEVEVVERNRWAYQNDFYFMTPFVCVFVFLIFLYGNYSKINTGRIRVLSALIYFIHVFVGNVLRDVITKLGLADPAIFNLFVPTLIISVISAVILTLLSEKFNILKKLYS